MIFDALVMNRVGRYLATNIFCARIVTEVMNVQGLFLDSRNDHAERRIVKVGTRLSRVHGAPHRLRSD